MIGPKVLRGVVHGKVIKLDDDTGIADGESVEITVRRVAAPDRKPGDGLLRTEGALAEDPEWDAIMEEIQQTRKQERRTPSNDA